MWSGCAWDASVSVACADASSSCVQNGQAAVGALDPASGLPSGAECLGRESSDRVRCQLSCAAACTAAGAGFCADTVRFDR